MTTANFHSPQPEADNLLANIINYTASSSGSSSDFYKIQLVPGDKLDVTALVPANNTGEFVNLLDPALRIYDPAGNVILTSDPANKREASLSYKIPNGQGGTYYVEV